MKKLLIILFSLAALFFLFMMKNADMAAIIFLSCVAVLAVAAVILANSWAKKRGN